MTVTQSANLLMPLPAAVAGEAFETLASGRGTLVRRIVSRGQATPAGEWCDQHHDEWVAVLAGEARLLIEGEAAARTLRPGDHVLIPARCRHRVEWTSTEPATVWLAVHFG